MPSVHRDGGGCLEATKNEDFPQAQGLGTAGGGGRLIRGVHQGESKDLDSVSQLKNRRRWKG